MTDELPEKEILEFVSSGCKSYAMKVCNLKTNEIEYIMKVINFVYLIDLLLYHLYLGQGSYFGLWHIKTTKLWAIQIGGHELFEQS